MNVKLPRGYATRFRDVCRQVGMKPEAYLSSMVVSAVNNFEIGKRQEEADNATAENIKQDNDAKRSG